MNFWFIRQPRFIILSLFPQNISILIESSKSSAEVAKSNKQWGICLYQEEYQLLLISKRQKIVLRKRISLVFLLFTIKSGNLLPSFKSNYLPYHSVFYRNCRIFACQESHNHYFHLCENIMKIFAKTKLSFCEINKLL